MRPRLFFRFFFGGGVFPCDTDVGARQNGTCCCGRSRENVAQSSLASSVGKLVGPSGSDSQHSKECGTARGDELPPQSPSALVENTSEMGRWHLEQTETNEGMKRQWRDEVMMKVKVVVEQAVGEGGVR